MKHYQTRHIRRFRSKSPGRVPKPTTHYHRDLYSNRQKIELQRRDRRRRWCLHATITCIYLLTTTIACSNAPQNRCHGSSDCKATEICRMGTCLSQDEVRDTHQGILLNTPSSAKRPTKGATHPQTPTKEEPLRCKVASIDDLHLEEILAQVPNGLAGDANGDGLRDPYDDEFIKISNSNDEAVSLRGVVLKINSRVVYTYPRDLCLPAKSYLTLFSKTQTPSSNTLSANKRLNLNNSGGRVEISDDAGNIFDTFTYTENSTGSWVRIPINTGDFKKHGKATDRKFSPGTCPNGSPWDGSC